jgi:predicted TIM-barrel fold metal-dependent hydrolase
MSRLTVISTDDHAGLPTERYREYLERRYHAELDEYLVQRQMAWDAGVTLGSNKRGFAAFNQQFLDDYRNEPLRETGGPRGGWEFDVRVKELEADGVVAEVIFPGPVNMDVETSIPFQGRAFFGDAFTADHSLDSMWAGARAYNRWLGEVFDPARQAPLVLVPSVADVDLAIAELRWGAQAGFRGVILRQQEDGVPLLYDPRYEPLWDACEDLGLPVHFHGGVGLPLEPDSTSPHLAMFSSIETAWWGYRPIWHLIFAGVLERHPSLQVVFAEMHGSWAPSVIDMLDVRYEDQWLQYRDILPHKPSDYWKRQCFVGASFLSRREVEMREQIGEDKLMYASDYPHVEGIWPQTPHYLHEVFAGFSPELARKLCAENAAAIYGFDLAHLDAVAANVGPVVEDVVSGQPSPIETHATDRMAARAARPANWVMSGPPRT